MISEQRKQEIVAAFQRSFKRDNSGELASITLEELRDTDAMHGDRDINAGFRLRLRQRIRDLEDERRKRQVLRTSVINYFVAFLSGVAVTVVSHYIFS